MSILPHFCFSLCPFFVLKSSLYSALLTAGIFRNIVRSFSVQGEPCNECFQVDYVEPSQNIVHLKLLPRVDYTRHRGALKSMQNVSELSSLIGPLRLGSCRISPPHFLA